MRLSDEATRVPVEQTRSPLDIYRSAVAPLVVAGAAAADDAGELPDATIATLARHGLLVAALPAEQGGLGAGDLALGELVADAGGACGATRCLLTVQDMVAGAIQRWGSAEQRERWLPGLAGSTLVAGFALTEPEAGSEAAAVRTAFVADGAGWRVSGTKTWVTFGARADVLLVIGRCVDGPVAAIVPTGAEGVDVVPVSGGALGLRGAAHADVTLRDVPVGRADQLGPVGAGLSHIAATALDRGRYTVAWGCAGSSWASYRLAAAHAATREQYGVPLSEHQLIRRHLTDLVADARTARLLCADAARARTARDPEAPLLTMLAKYRASRIAYASASLAVQVLGARGCAPSAPAQRLFRDAKVHQIIEGTDEILQLEIAAYALRRRDAEPGA